MLLHIQKLGCHFITEKLEETHEMYNRNIKEIHTFSKISFAILNYNMHILTVRFIVATDRRNLITHMAIQFEARVQ